MTALKRELETIWTQLRSQKPGRANSLEEIHLKGIRGIKDLRIPLPFPVTVLAGPNGCGKSTVLFALACSYRNKDAGKNSFTPTTLFRDFKPKKTGNEDLISDGITPMEINSSYVANNERLSMKWARKGKNWSRSFFGKKGGRQPERALYLRTLANLSNPSEVRSVLQLANGNYKTETVDASNIAFAQRILDYRYAKLSVISEGLKSLLFAERENEKFSSDVRYSEFHMSAGERAVLRLSMSISKVQDALVLIDEIEAGLHPFIQQLLMLELQRLALRNQLQVVVTTHSPVILETVPPEAQVFLERNEDNVIRREPYRDIIQKALYGRSQDTLSIICEDEEAEAFIRGVLDYLGPKMDFLQNDIQVGRDTGKDQFPSHLEALAKFRKLDDMVFILDGDARSSGVGARMEARAKELRQIAKVLYLPGNESPEAWGWEAVKKDSVTYAKFLGLTPENLQKQLNHYDNLYSSATDKPSAISKNKFYSFAGQTEREVKDIIRFIGKTEAGKVAGEVYEFVTLLQDIILAWRSSKN
ncbi:MAG: ATP-binding protein [Candidatus Aminicenantes bacterium]|nr:ATP-binding protein [Candidatus Aminicenantes bacterium]